MVQAIQHSHDANRYGAGGAGAGNGCILPIGHPCRALASSITTGKALPANTNELPQATNRMDSLVGRGGRAVDRVVGAELLVV